jgi:hypothetical protein
MEKTAQRGATLFVCFANYKVEEDHIGGACGGNGGEEDRALVIDRKARGKETTRNTKTTREDNIEIDLVEIGLDGVGWICLAQDRDK